MVESTLLFSYDYPRPSVTVDCVVFGLGTKERGKKPPLQVLLIERGGEPFQGKLALPGGFVNVSDEGDQGEDLEIAARRELEEETSVHIEYLEQLCTVGTPGRDPRGRVITIAYMALVRTADHKARGGDDAKEAAWHSVSDLLRSGTRLAFDHHMILHTAYQRLKGKIRYMPIGFNLLPSTFTMLELRRLYETILMRDLDPSNFQKKMRSMKILRDAGTQESGQHRPAKLFKFDKKAYGNAVKNGFNFEI